MLSFTFSQIRDVSIKVTMPGSGAARQTVALSPGLSVYKAIYQAALVYDYDDGEGNPFDIAIEPDIHRKCYVVDDISGQKSNDDAHWWIIVMDATDQVFYKIPSFFVLTSRVAKLFEQKCWRKWSDL
jgi:hypothetical protein